MEKNAFVEPAPLLGYIDPRPLIKAPAVEVSRPARGCEIMVVGVGVDLVSVARVERAYRRRPRRFLRRIFSAAELSLLLPRRAFFPAMAARFAAKEAVLKAIGCGAGPASWKEVEIIAPPGREPQVRLSGVAARLAEERGIGRIALSMTHEPPFAGAIAVACRSQNREA